RNDEIGELAKTFVQMGTAIKESRTEIEGKVSEQTMDMKLQKDKLETQQIAILNILDDVELEKAKSDRLAEDLNKYKLAVDSASDQIIITDEKGVIVYANKTLEQITGYSIEEAVGTKAGKLWGGLMSSEFYENMWKIISDEKKPYQCELQNKRKDGSKYDAQLSIAPVLDSNSEVKFFVGIERDISKEKSIDRMKTEFISLASHQLRTPLSAMKWLAEMLLNNDAGELNDKQRELLTDINTSNERMISLVNSLLNIARIESGRIMVEPKPTNLKDLVDKILKEIRQAISAKKQKCNIDIDEAIKDINIDPNLIGEVFKNLITNANKYTPKSGEITIRITQDETNIICEVADNGYGIPKADLPSIFQKFFRSDNILEHDAEGTGLGLYLVKTIIESSEGEINIESAEGKGSKFIFTLLKAGMQKKSGDVTIS
ncbi:PAS domain S-box protein, partial [Candidatus Peregrinibacteria bacterium]|nr:PAS domain S-box protein [Candidatus Peregrinibacteria bacterium]